jgi:hypothetical protein
VSVLGDFGKRAGFPRKGEEQQGETIAARLFEALESEWEEAGIADIWHYGFTIEMELINGEYWAIECVGGDAFRFYPGVVGEEGVIWLNVWIAPELTLEELTERLNETAVSARRKNLNA